MTFPPEVWSGVLRRLREQLPAFAFEAWVAPLALGDSSRDRVVVLCPTHFHRDRVRHTLRDPIAAAFGEALGGCPALDFDVARADAARVTSRAPARTATRETASTTERAAPKKSQAPPPCGATNGVRVATATARSDHERHAPSATAPSGARVRESAPPPLPMRRVRLADAELPTASAGATVTGQGPLAQTLAQTTSHLRIGPGTGRPGAPNAHAPLPPARAQHPARPARSERPARGMRTSTPLEEVRARRSMNPAAARQPGGGPRPAEQQLLPYPFSFGNFVVGPCNALAREAAFAVAGGQEMALKQLYLASAPGLGKTHLARAVAAEVARQSARPVRYASTEVFTSEFVAALRNKTTSEFKRRYRPERGGLLVLEDVQFLAAKRATQLEFFHSVQHVLDAGGRVLLTGDRMPQDMTDLDERVREQLARGFVAGLETPDAIVRRRILRMKAANGAIALPDDCLDLLVESVNGNVRELEGVLMQVVTTSTLLKRPIDLELTKRAIAQKVQAVAPPARRPEITDVIAVVASFFRTSPATLAARSRKRDVLVPRQLAMYLCHRHTDAPLADIGRALDRDHPSVRNAIKKVEREMLENPKRRYEVEALTTRIQERMG